MPKITPTFQANRSVIARDLLGPAGAGTTELHVIRPGDGCDARFLLFALSTRPFLLNGAAQLQGVAGQKRVPDEYVRDYQLRLPSLTEQRRIADRLERETTRIDGLVRVYLQVKERLLSARTSIIAAGVSGSEHGGPRRATRLPWLDEVPVHWDEAKLTHLARLGSGHTPSRDRPDWWSDCTIPWVTTGEVWQMRDDRIEFITQTREKISALGVANSSAVVHPAGTVVLCRTAASAGFSAIMGTDMATSQDIVTWTCGDRLRPRYLLLCLRAMRQDLLGRLAMGSTHKTIYMPDVQSIRVPVPPIDEQDRLVTWAWTRLELVDQAADAIDRQVSLLLERREAIITAAILGDSDSPQAVA